MMRASRPYSYSVTSTAKMTLLLMLLLHGSLGHVAANILLAVTTRVPPVPLVPVTSSSANFSDISAPAGEEDSTPEDVHSTLQLGITTTLRTGDDEEYPLETTVVVELETRQSSGTKTPLQTSTPLKTTITTPSTTETSTFQSEDSGSVEEDETVTPTMTTDQPLEPTTTTPSNAHTMGAASTGITKGFTTTTTTRGVPKLPANLQSLSLVLFNASSANVRAHQHPPSPPNHNRESNNILGHDVRHLNPPAFSSPVTQQSASSSSSSSSSPSLLQDSASSSSSYASLADDGDDPSSSSSISSSLEPMDDIRMRVTSTPDSILNLTGELGGSVFLPCTTHHSMERQVSWVRRRDWHILTSGTLAYTKEERFSVHHPEGSTDWTLVIKYIELSDAGTYECQVSTGNGILSRLVELAVVEPRAVIPGNGEYHIDVGSTITLDCFIHQSLVAPQYIFWYHNSRMINYDRERGGVNVQIDTGPQVRSRLTVNRATPADSGNYTCAAANSKPAYTTVYITNGNKIAAIQPRAMAEGVKLECSKMLFTLVVSVSLLNSVR
ncbi:basement membrane-specific heparan sulfate proteoglycan core protein-like [Macrobrachium nipponense]|uniref:basement membrane-specific heparan sulfate proteoglycan core protein-like n=1 Tax=Macrobrachium nipponense TaxID=159736 RepID=UPI0030C8C52F